MQAEIPNHRRLRRSRAGGCADPLNVRFGDRSRVGHEATDQRVCQFCRLLAQALAASYAAAADPVGAGHSAVVVDLPRWGPMLSPRVPNLVPIPGPRMSAKPLVSAHDRIMGTHRLLGF